MSHASRDEIAAAVSAMPVVNHHEHCWQSFSTDHTQEFDLPYFLYQDYLESDLLSAGLQRGPELFAYLNDPSLPDDSERAWHTLRAWLDKVRTTSYFRYLLRALQDLFDVTESDIFYGDWREISAQIRVYSRQHKGQGAALSARMGVPVTVLDAKIPPEQIPLVDPPDHTLLHVARLDMFIHEKRGLSDTLSTLRPRDFEHWLALFDDAIQKNLQAGAVGFKSGLAYNRRIEYSDPSLDEATSIFARGLNNASTAEMTTYQDNMVNRLCRLCVEANVPLQIHTGMQGGIRHMLEDTQPTLLTGLFQRHGDLRFDLFHGGYPWYEHAGLMAKYFPNVYVDGCWLHHISPSGYRAALTTWIETVPLHKIFAWGGDHTMLEHSYASLSLARDLVTDVLADLVERGYFDVELAKETARRILHDNGMEFWRLTSHESRR